MSFTREEINDGYALMLKKFNPSIGDCGFSWIQHVSTFGLFNEKEIMLQIKEWKRINVKALEYNNKEFVINGRKWYILIAQPYKDDKMEECGFCPISLLLFDTAVNGYTYAFSNKVMRDLVFRILSMDYLRVEVEDITEQTKKANVIAEELLTNPDIIKQPPKQKKENKMTKQELTRQANKANAETKKRKEEFDRRASIAQSQKAEQQKKKQRDIARKKREAQEKASLALLQQLEQ